MEWLEKLGQYIKNSNLLQSAIIIASGTAITKTLIFNNDGKTKTPPAHNEITMVKEQTDEQIEINETRKGYINIKTNPDYVMKKGDTVSKIAKNFGVEERTILQLNGLTKESATKLQPGKTLKIPPTRAIKSEKIKNLNDVAKSMGVSYDFIIQIKHIEDGREFGDNKFHNTPYIDAGVESIGIGHVLRPEDPRYLNNKQVCEYLAKDLLRMEENLCALVGKSTYEKLPQPIKEALLDMMLNKGPAIIENTEGLLYCLKNGKYESAINKFTDNKTVSTNEELSGLSKRRLLDIAMATKMFNGNIPASNKNTAQQVYNHGIELLRIECKKKHKDFKSVVAGYNSDIQSYFNDRIKLKYITE